MSIHSSLRAGGKGKRHRSVLKRYERLRILKEKNLWGNGKSVLGIPKVKLQKMRLKKEKAVPATETAAAEGTAVAAKPAAAASPAKPSEKK